MHDRFKRAKTGLWKCPSAERSHTTLQTQIQLSPASRRLCKPNDTRTSRKETDVTDGGRHTATAGCCLESGVDHRLLTAAACPASCSFFCEIRSGGQEGRAQTVTAFVLGHAAKWPTNAFSSSTSKKGQKFEKIQARSEEVKKTVAPPVVWWSLFESPIRSIKLATSHSESRELTESPSQFPSLGRRASVSF